MNNSQNTAATVQTTTDQLPLDAPTMRYLMEKSRRPKLGAYVAIIQEDPAGPFYGSEVEVNGWLMNKRREYRQNGVRLAQRSSETYSRAA